MKKVIGLLLALSCLFVFAGCNSPLGDGDIQVAAKQKTGGGIDAQASAYALFVESRDVVEAAQSMEADYSMAMSYRTNSDAFEEIGGDLDMTLSGHLAMLWLNGEDVQFSMTMAMSMLGVTLDVDAYYTDGFYYMDMFGQKTKTPMEVDEALNQNGSQLSMVEDINIPEEAVVSSSIETDENGQSVLILDIDYFQLENAENAFDELIGEYPGANFDIPLCRYIITLGNQGYYTGVEMQLGMDFGYLGEELGIDFVMTMSNIQLNTVQQIDFPDLSQYS